MNNNVGGFPQAIRRGGFWFAGIVFTCIIAFYFYEKFDTKDAVASENEEIVLDHTRFNADEAVEHESASSSINSILSDSDSLCLIAMNNTSSTSISISERSSITANGCAVHANSKTDETQAIHVEARAKLDAPVVHSNGKLLDQSSNNVDTLTVSEQISDPLSYMNAPDFSECDYRNISIKAGLNTLKPGVYCGGLIALGDSDIVLEPGIYILKNGPLVLGGKAALSGEHVSIYFTGSNSVLNLGVSSKVALTAPLDGPMAGILFFEDRNSPGNNEFIIRSGNAQLLEGVMYLPKAKFVAAAAAQIGQKANWTALIANKIEMRNSAAMNLNSDFQTSQIPVPEGIWPGLPVAVLSN